MPKLAENTMDGNVDSVATSSQYIGKPPTPIPIHISINRLLPSLVQVPNRIQGGGRVHVDLRKRKATIWKDHYPLPFKDPMHGRFEGHVVENIPLHVVGSTQA